MQLVSATVRLGGKVDQEVLKGHEPIKGGMLDGISVAEVAVLRFIHGNDAVTQVQALRQDKRSHQFERKRLQTLYGDTVVDKLFPGVTTKLPISLKDIEIENFEEEVERLDAEKIGEDA